MGGLIDAPDSWSEQRFATTLEMNAYHNGLLTSHNPSCAVMGYLSIIFWGHFSGQDGVVRIARARAKAQKAWRALQPDQGDGITDAANAIHLAARLIALGRSGDAVELLSTLPQLGPAFASKVCAFLAPQRCGVIDSIIASKYPEFGFALSGGYVKKEKNTWRSYETYCVFLREQADSLNQRGESFCWKDRDGRRHRWRAVDVERAIF
jgi:hypothetical protein